MREHKFENFTLELVPECDDVPMCIKIGSPGFSIDLPARGAFHYVPLTESKENIVMFKMDNSTSNPPEVTFVLSNIELEMLVEVSVLPVIG
ncbi:conserved hypothetical protein [Vibrio nigripulchritudo FTn2]|uniref:hypothetical protein n=1 Tax=Vibrio nigripulchritudo TaxID=28173 RepID=UPI0003B1B63B|nr:hypothetical protein [Vibrio nigripulchritudo]CCN39708.1 conserved hypothetical protein [Vibrio nigripulchritudo FTn2]